MKVLQSLGNAFHFGRLPAGPLGQKFQVGGAVASHKNRLLWQLFSQVKGTFFFIKVVVAKGKGRKGNPLNGLYAFLRYFTSP